MPNHTDSHIVEYNEDGTWVETTVVHGRPATKKEKALAASLLGAVVFAPLVPLGAIIAYDKYEEWRAKRENAKKLKSV